MIIRLPSSAVTNIAVITASGNVVSVRFPEKHERFIEICKSLSLRWSWPEWSRSLIARNGDTAARAAELGHRLLLAGFPIEIADQTVAQKAISGDYEPEHTRWISRMVSGPFTDWFAINWRRDEDFYKQAKRLSGARYRPPNVVVPNTQYEQIMDFATTHDFRLTDGAQSLAAEARASWESAVMAQPAPQKARVTKKPRQEGIADELKDDPL